MFKYILLFFYLILIILFLYKFTQILEINSLSDFSFEIIQKKLNKIQENNYYLLIMYFFIFSLIWTFFLGFISPILLAAGYMFSPMQGAIIVSLANALSGSILVFIIRNYFINDFKKIDYFRVDRIINFINKDINLYFLVFRLAGGFGAPQQVQNLIPSVTKIKILNYILISIVGCMPVYYISSSIGYSLNFILETKNLDISIFSNIKFLISIAIIVTILILIKFLKKKFKI